MPRTNISGRQQVMRALRFLLQYRKLLLIGVLSLFATNGFDMLIPRLVKRAIDAIESAGRATLDASVVARSIALLALAIAVTGLLRAATRILSRIAIFNAAREAEYALRNKLMAHLTILDRSFFRRFRTGDLMSRLTNDLSSVRGLFGPGVLYAMDAFFAYSTALPLMFGLDPLLAGLALLPQPIVLLCASLFARRIYHSTHAQQEALAGMTSQVQEDLTGIGEVKTYQLESTRHDRFSRISHQYLGKAVAVAAWRGAMGPLVSLGLGLGVVLLLFVGGARVSSGETSLSSVVALHLYLARLAFPTMALGWILSAWQRGVAGWHRLEQILLTQPQLKSAVVEKAVVEGGGLLKPTDGALGSRQSRGSLIEVRNLSLEIEGRLVLRDISLTLASDSLCALVGRVGSGKTTLLEALARLVDVPPGTVFFDGRDVTHLPLSLIRKQVGYAPQRAFLFSETLRQNVLFGLSEGCDETEANLALHQAVEFAGLQRDLEALPQGLDTLVGERGVTLSGGQRQRAALARALLSKRPLLLLDDTLSAVDAETEEVILARLSQATSESTTLLVSHRLSALQHVDRIFVLDEGRLVEQGTHRELIQSEGLYQRLYRRQLLAADPNSGASPQGGEP